MLVNMIIEPPHEKTSNIVSEQARRKQATQAQKLARRLKLWILEAKGCICVAKTQALISFAVTAKLICAFGFAYTDYFFHEAAQLLVKSCLNVFCLDIAIK